MVVKYVSYLRVSTAKQGRSGLGKEAQRASISEFLKSRGGDLVKEFVENESGKNNDRPQLAEALRLCKQKNATLIIAKLDRLSRDAAFLLKIQNGNVPFVAADMPDANELTVGIMAVVAQAERKMISIRTTSALAAAKARGTRLGGWRGTAEKSSANAIKARQAAIEAADDRAATVGPMIREMQAQGLSLRGIAAALTGQGVLTARDEAQRARDQAGEAKGKVPVNRAHKEWTATAVRNVLSRLPPDEAAREEYRRAVAALRRTA
jgi:DNA invertase Pin-like site-specific DNA recombinase